MPSRTGSPPATVEQIPVPPHVSGFSSLARVDYSDAFRVTTARGRKRGAEAWMRAVLEDAPAPMRAQLLSGWTALGLKLARPGREGSVLGWEVRHSEPGHVRLGADSRAGMPAELLLFREKGALLFSTYIQFESAAVRLAWKAVEPVHCPIVRLLLARAAGA